MISPVHQLMGLKGLCLTNQGNYRMTGFSRVLHSKKSDSLWLWAMLMMTGMVW